jgi:hypothetical protein
MAVSVLDQILVQNGVSGATSEMLTTLYDVLHSPVAMLGSQAELGIESGYAARMLYALTVSLPRNAEWQKIAGYIIPMLSQYAIQIREVSKLAVSKPDDSATNLMLGRVMDQGLNIFMAAFELSVASDKYIGVLGSLLAARGS